MTREAILEEDGQLQVRDAVRDPRAHTIVTDVAAVICGVVIVGNQLVIGFGPGDPGC
jgi:hypothetical protein